MGTSEGADHTISVGVAIISLTRLDPLYVAHQCKNVLHELKTHIPDPANDNPTFEPVSPFPPVVAAVTLKKYASAHKSK